MVADVTVFDDDRALARTLAERIAARLAAKPALVLGLPTGRSPIRLYRELAALYARGRADFAQATTFNLDEFFGIAANHPGSYHTYMRQHLFSKVNLSPERINVLDGTAADPDVECRRYDAAIAAAGGLDLQILGIGTNGHIGFNEPATTLAGPTHRTPLKLSTRRSNAALFGGDVDRVPREALSMGMATILYARRIVVIATGKSKARCVERALGGPITTKLPASFLQLHRNVEWMLDRAAAGQ